MPTFRRFANADSFLFSDPGRVEAQAARAPFEHANRGVFAPPIVPEGATQPTGTDFETTGYPTGFANADSFLFSDPGRVEAQAARAPLEHTNLGVFAPLVVPE